MTFAAIGVDGVSFRMIKQLQKRQNSTFSVLDGITYNAAELYCDVDPHTAPSWTTIWSGIHSDEHGIWNHFTYIKDGEEYKERTQDLADNYDEINYYDWKDYPTFLWEDLYENGLDARAFGVRATMPALYFRANGNFHNLRHEAWWEVPKSSQELKRSDNRVKKGFMDNLDADFVCGTYLTTDKIMHHIDRGRHGWDEMARVYERVDSQIVDIINRVDDWIIVSDHGQPGPLTPHGWCGHQRDGIVISNIDEKLPVNVTDVHDWIIDNINK